ncbi:aminoacyl-tRNA hydrolase [Candidatus Peregrinibacteria bacterium CG10_big_fil_rev_8_21_14_0_10_49_16]|nr:MAG: aminoacyl-tRNA hydrolase [Candidatus Peregrinibacteria bacterium CG22_combo_CG10-13_8_21_14_all_49_11]PIR52067.1 MAG: aminoacyl-tRNA hydrolase [Candidatus Peregrinibacteria bacterium CG10_big_fil_rev_8_21_14_0_10_49_16]
MKPSLVCIGLGNPGKQYEQTRHNLGFQAMDTLKEEYGEGEWSQKSKFAAEVCDARIVTVPCLLAKPQTYMNCSGEAVKKLVDFYKLDPAMQILVFCDDIDVQFGELRMRESGGPGTHNGLKSVVEHIGENFYRIRIGIGPKPENVDDLATWVLSRPSEGEQKKLHEALLKIPEMVKEFVLR